MLGVVEFGTLPKELRCSHRKFTGMVVFARALATVPCKSLKCAVCSQIATTESLAPLA